MTVELTPQLIAWIVTGVLVSVGLIFAIYCVRRPDDGRGFSCFCHVYGFTFFILAGIVTIALICMQMGAMFEGHWFFWQWQ